MKASSKKDESRWAQKDKAAAPARPARVAIVGMSCLFPGAPDLASFWSNIVGAVDATREVGEREWDTTKYYDPDGQKNGLSYSRRGGFVSEYADFDPLKFGVMPSAVAGSDADQFLTLRVAVDAMRDAGYDGSHGDKKIDHDRAEIILGRISAPGAGSMNLIHQSKTVREVRAILEEVMVGQDQAVIDAVVKQMQDKLVPCTADNIPGAMPNVLAGRIAAKLGFRGRNLLIDAACASSMVAIETAVNDLLEKRCDFALAGGVHINASAVFFQMFCGLGALSHKDNIRPFDQEADGTMLGEGVGIVCLKRYEDAVADGDRIYATICGVASSSDGHGGSVLAPSLEGEALAMQKAYDMAGISPRTVQLLEAHGTGTPVGDVVELQAVAKIFSRDQTEVVEPWCAVGSIKSMIGHCQSASAVAGVIKAALALHHKVLPPTLHVTKPNQKIDWAKHPCYVNSKTRPWIKAEDSHPRRAAVSAFGFGGVNGHMILEENAQESPLNHDATEGNTAGEQSLMRVWERELFTFTQPTLPSLESEVSALIAHLRDRATRIKAEKQGEHQSDSYLKDLAYTVNCQGRDHKGESKKLAYRLALVASSPEDLLDKLTFALENISGAGGANEKTLNASERGIYFSTPAGAYAPLGGKLAFLYPGLGSAYTNMLADLCMHFPEVRDVFEIVDRVALSAGAVEPPSKSIFPPPFDKGQRAVPTLLAAADFAVVAVLLAEYAIYQLLMHLGVKPDVIMGCSTGEFAAITTTGSVDVLSVAKNFYQLSTRVARSIPEESLAKLRTLRVLASWQTVEALSTEKIYLSADLGDSHVIVTGDLSAIDALTAALKDKRIPCQLLPVPIPYHTPLVASIIDANNEAVQAVDIQPLATPGWSCSTAERYPDDVEAMRASFVELFTKPIGLKETVRNMYDDGVRTFVEVGPNGILTSSMDGILGDKPHVAVPTNLASRSGVAQIQHLLAVLFTQAKPADLAFLYKRRDPQIIEWLKNSGKSTDTTAKESAGRVAGRARKLGLTHTALTIDTSSIENFATGFELSSRAGRADHNDDESDEDYDNDDEYHDESGEESGDAFDGNDDFNPENVLQTFMETNAAFYSKLNALSEEVMRSYIQTGADGEDGEDGGELGSEPGIDEDLNYEFESEFEAESENGEEDNLPADNASIDQAILQRPFLRRARVVQREDETDLYLKLDLATDLYLLDHAIGGLVSTVKNTRVHLVPLMVTLEIMAEAALAHVQWGVPVRVAHVRAFRRIVVDDKGLTVKAIVRGDADKAVVSLVDAADPDSVYATAEFIFSDHYIDHPNFEVPPQLAVPGGPATVLTKPDKLYQCGPMSMFHGPTMQAVRNIETVGNKAIGGKAAAGGARQWLADDASGERADFLLHPLLLDNSSQFVLFYLYEKLLPATALLPFLIESLDISQHPDELAEQVDVAAVLPTLSERATEANLEVVNAGKLAIKINGINSRRVVLSEQWQNFVAEPARSFLAGEVKINDILADSGVIMQIDRAILPEDDVILEWCLDYILTRSEQLVWRNQSKTKKRKVDWLLGRIAAKEAVRKLVAAKTGIVLGPHDIEIVKQSSGAPLVKIDAAAVPGLPPVQISISHTENVAVAFATLSGAQKPGIDAEVVRDYEPSFAATFLKPHELQYLASCPGETFNTELTRLWSAKEALFKACHGAVEMSSFALATPAPGPDVIVMTGGEPSQASNTYVSTSADLVIAYTLR